MSYFERRFQLPANGTSIRQEIVAGLTTFAAMAYILAVNPVILSAAGMDRGAVLTATALAAALGSFLMGTLTNLPIAQAPGMGLNAFFAFSICIGLGIPWQAALGLVFYSGVLFFILSITGVRRLLVESIPIGLKTGISCGIGLFIALLGLKNSGIIVADENTLVTLGDFQRPEPILGLAGIVLAAVLIARKVPAAILLTVFVLTVTGFFLHDPNGRAVTGTPEALVSAPASIAPVFLALDLGYLWTHFAVLFPVVLALLFVDLFDTMGTLIGVCQRGGFLDAKGNIPRINQALTADATASMTGALLGTSTTTSYIESAAGVEEGGRTGLTAWTVSACFLLALFFTPLLLIVPPAATGPVLVVVGIFMMQGLREVRLDDWLTAVPALVIVMAIPLTFSISDGIALGFIVHTALCVGTGRFRELSWVTILLAAVFFLHLVFAKT
ncbi:MAG: NCS2 family permease [Terrimicrobiaceae bacterium]|nr:NCS2 family permease [Terrimicrobiaceae bacterium]